jgi:cell division control protein 24
MTNVTEVLSFAKPGKPRVISLKLQSQTNHSHAGSYTVQIWWKGDPGVENFIIKFTNEETMKKWAAGLDAQRKENAPASSSPEQTSTEFAWMRNVNNMENPYAQHDEEDDDDDEQPQRPMPHTSHSAHPSLGYNGSSASSVMSRDSSSTNLMRARSATGESQHSLSGPGRVPPSRFPMPPPAGSLSLQTQGAPHSPNMRPGESYFSPTVESPASSRTSTASTLYSNSNAQYPFPRTSTPQGGWSEDNNRYTAPAMPRAPSRDGSSPVNAFGANGRAPRGPSLPVMASHSQSLLQQQRNRSHSTPDINGQPQQRRTNSSIPNPPVPGIPPHLHPAHDSNIPRSQTGSPRQDIPIRSNTQSPGAQRDRTTAQSGQYGGTMAQFPTQPVYPRQSTPNPPSQGPTSSVPQPLILNNHSSVSPPLGTGTYAQPLQSPDLPIPTQLKVKVNCDSGNYVTLVVAFNITYQSLIDRIDAKLARFTNSSIAKGNLRLRYRDEDGDFVTIESDDDIQIAFLEWREGVRNMYSGGVGEIELFCVGDTG